MIFLIQQKREGGKQAFSIKLKIVKYKLLYFMYEIILFQNRYGDNVSDTRSGYLLLVVICKFITRKYLS